MQKVPVGMSKDGMVNHELEIVGLKYPHEQLGQTQFESVRLDQSHSFALCGPSLFVGF